MASNFKSKSGLEVEEKGVHYDLVTKIDIASQELIRRRIIEEAKVSGLEENELGFIGEESLNIGGKHVFVIDPIDGTTNFALGVDYFCISIGYLIDNQIVSGVVYDPIRKEMYFAEKGKGAKMENNKSTSSLMMKQKKLNQCAVTSHLNNQSLVDLLAIYKELLPNTRGGTALGSVTLEMCYLASGKRDILINGNCYQWDLAAATLILEEANGSVVDWAGNKILFNPLKSREPFKIVAAEISVLPRVLAFFQHPLP